MRSPAVSGAQSYKERRLAELKKRQQYSRAKVPTPQGHTSKPAVDSKITEPIRPKPTLTQGVRKCYNCDKPGHLARDCRSKKSESAGRPTTPSKLPKAKQVCSSKAQDPTLTVQSMNPLSSSEDEIVHMIRVHDKGSTPQCVKVLIQGAPHTGYWIVGQTSPSLEETSSGKSLQQHD